MNFIFTPTWMILGALLFSSVFVALVYYSSRYEEEDIALDQDTYHREDKPIDQ